MIKKEEWGKHSNRAAGEYTATPINLGSVSRYLDVAAAT
jgi:hypothetical protein